MKTGIAVAVVREGALLLGRRIAIAGNGAYQIPGGKPDDGESVAVTAARELAEETALVATSVSEVCEQIDTFVETGESWRTIFVLATVDPDAVPENLEPEKCEGWAFYPLDALPEPLFLIDPETLDAIAKAAA